MEIDETGSIKNTCAKCCFPSNKYNDRAIKNQLIKDNKNCVENVFSFYLIYFLFNIIFYNMRKFL